MTNKEDKTLSFKKSNKNSFKEKLILTDDGNVILYEREDKRLSYKAKNKKTYGV